MRLPTTAIERNGRVIRVNDDDVPARLKAGWKLVELVAAEDPKPAPQDEGRRRRRIIPPEPAKAQASKPADPVKDAEPPKSTDAPAKLVLKAQDDGKTED